MAAANPHRYGLWLSLLLWATLCPTISSAQSFREGWSTVSDRRLGLIVQYPAQVFVVNAGKTEKHQGSRFRTSDGRAEFVYYGFPNNSRESPAAYLKRTLLMDRTRLIYQRVTENFFVISSSRQGRIFYSRCNFGDLVRCIYLEYPADEKLGWDNIVARISYSLR